MGSESNAHDGRTCRVVADYATPFPDPLVLRAGQQLAVGDRKSEWHGWLWCTTRDGKSAWVPEGYVTLRGKTATLRCDYDATELSVHAGEELILELEESGWLWCANRTGRRGWVPANHVKW